MIILCYGMPKSASSFVFQMVVDMANLAGYSQSECRERYLEADMRHSFQNLYSARFRSFLHAIPKEELYVLKTHGNYCELISQALTRSEISALATFRDPLDIAVSLLDVGQSERKSHLADQREYFANIHTIDDVVTDIDKYVLDAEKWLLDPLVLNIPYNDILMNAEAVAIKIQEFFNLGDQAESVCRNYLADKNKIWEYNIGGNERWKGRLTQEEASSLMNRYSQFRAKWL